MNTTYDLAILGGGPAGVAAGVYAARKQLKTIFITKDWLGQSNVSEGVENWIGDIKIPGLELSKKLEAHLKSYAGDVVHIKEGEWVKEVELVKNAPTDASLGGLLGEPSGRVLGMGNQGTARRENVSVGAHTFKITTDKGSYEAKTILIATGSSRRKLDIPGADRLEHKGLTYCASCDGPIFAGQDVAVVGGGNAGFETAAQLLAYCKSVTLLNRSGEIKADPVTVEAVLANPKMKAIKNAIPKEIQGDKFVSGLVYTDATTKKDMTLAVTGIFAEIGSIPNTDFIKNIVKLDQYNRIPIDPRNQRASLSHGSAGIWAAGDATDGLFHQNNIAAGDAVKALEDLYLFLKAQ